MSTSMQQWNDVRKQWEECAKNECPVPSVVRLYTKMQKITLPLSRNAAFKRNILKPQYINANITRFPSQILQNMRMAQTKR